MQLLINAAAPGKPLTRVGNYPWSLWAISYTRKRQYRQTLKAHKQDTTHTAQGCDHGWISSRKEGQRDLAMQNRDAFREKRLGFLFLGNTPPRGTPPPHFGSTTESPTKSGFSHPYRRDHPESSRAGCAFSASACLAPASALFSGKPVSEHFHLDRLCGSANIFSNWSKIQ